LKSRVWIPTNLEPAGGNPARLGPEPTAERTWMFTGLTNIGVFGLGFNFRAYCPLLAYRCPAVRIAGGSEYRYGSSRLAGLVSASSSLSLRTHHELVRGQSQQTFDTASRRPALREKATFVSEYYSPAYQTGRKCPQGLQGVAIGICTPLRPAHAPGVGVEAE
jgi:hypothetical protein